MAAISLDDVRIENFRKYLQCFEFKSASNGENKYFCRIKECNRSYKDKSASIRHLANNHSTFYALIQKNNDEKSIKTQTTALDIRVRVDPGKIWDAVVELVTIDSVPLRFVDHSAFKTIIEPYVTALKAQGYALTINREGLRSRINEMAANIRNDITTEVKGKMIGLMADIASRYSKSVLGISISYTYNGEIRVRTIACHVLKYSHTAVNIHGIIMQTLSEYEISLSQVISVTTDNGRNMIKAIACLDSSYQASKEADDCNEADEHDEFIDHSIFDDQYYEDVLSGVKSLFAGSIHTDIIHGISCAAHCLHLVVTHAIEKTPAIGSLIEEARKLAKRLRTPTLRAMMIECGCNMAKIDVVTRWNSALDMVCTLEICILLAA